MSTPPTNGAVADYASLVPRFRRLVTRAVPADATVLVVSKGDRELVSLDGRRGRHFPQRSDGVYAGHHPGDDHAAIAHLESLRTQGAEFFAIPATSLWWLDHYQQFRAHLDNRYPLVVKSPETGFVYALFDLGDPAARGDRPTAGAENGQRQETQDVVERLVGDEIREDLEGLFDLDFYSGQSGCRFDELDAAVRHYLEIGAAQGLDPHPLFDTSYYLARYPEVRALGTNPLLHFLANAAKGQQDPNPYFDTAYYYSQARGLRERGVNALVHYIRNGSADAAPVPNPLFGNGYYLNTYPDVRAAGVDPLTHYLLQGWRTGCLPSHIVRRMLDELRRSAPSPLLRGNWKDGSVLLFSRDGSDGSDGTLIRLADGFASEHLEALLVFLRGRPRGAAGKANVLVLEDYVTARDVLRPSALRMLAHVLAARRPQLALTDVAEVLDGLAGTGVPAYFLAGGGEDSPSLATAAASSRRLVFGSSEAFEHAAQQLGCYPTNVALRRPDSRPDGGGDADYVRSLLDLAAHDAGVAERPSTIAPESKRIRRIVIPCSDWTVSGVNASLEAVGMELAARGWDVEVVFTRDEEFVLESAVDETHLPRLPHRFLERRVPGVEAMWEALVADLEQRAPCILFTGYDFVGNSVIPALTDRVGAVAWVQADDGDYYEQVYRLGRYCNAVVCVSQHIARRVAELNPAIEDRCVVIHNSSVSEHDVGAPRRRRRRQLRLVYTGRLVQYQKRILDFVELAEALDERDVPYSISLIGAFARHESIEAELHRRARAHLDNGRIRLLGRLPRAGILDELSSGDFFVLLSDFEGLPLSLVEAMARGCVPVVPACCESGVPEIIGAGETGLVVDGRDYGEWADQIIRLWHNRRAYTAMAARAAEKVRERFTIEHVADQFDELFTRVADEIAAGTYERPPALTWGESRAPAGDVLPPPTLYRPVSIAGLR